MAFLKDLRYGARKLVRNPGFSALSVLTLAVGIGLTATMFSIVYGAIWRGLPFPESDRLMHVERNNLPADQQSLEVTLHDFADWRAQQKSFEGLAAFTSGTVNVSGTEKPERFDGAYMTANAFQLLHVQPHLGRTFRPGEDAAGAPAVVILGYDLWQERFDGDASIVGKTIRANGEEAEVIGVMPPKFRFPIQEDLWLPLRQPLPAVRGEGVTLEVYGRLKPGVSADQAATEMGGIAARLARTYPENKDIGAVIKPYTEEYIGDEVFGLLYTMLAAVFMVLLIACVNVANLLLSQAAMRAKEVGVRTAIGASRGRIIMQFLTEPLVLAGAGAVIGTGLAWVGVRLFNNAIASTDPPFWIDIKIDGPILLFVLAITVFATLVSGVLPAVRASKANVHEVLKDESRGSSSFRGGRLSKGLVVLEVALSVALLVAAGLAIKSVAKLRSQDYGFPTREVFTARIGLPETQYGDSAAQVRFFDQLQQRLPELGGAEAVALSAALPGVGSGMDQLSLEGKTYATERDYPLTHVASITPGFFDVFRLKVDGRDFTAQDRETTEPVAIVNQTFARKHFGGAAGAVGKRVRLGGPETTQPWRTVVGVVPDMWMDGPENERPEAVYLPFAQAPQRFMSVVARARGEPGGLTAPVRDLVGSIDPDLPIYFVGSLQERIAENTWFYRVFGGIFMIMGIVALFLAGIGLYGVMAFNVSRRTREMGVRMALGAQPGDVTRLVLRQGLIQLGIGIALGIGLAYALASALKMILFQVSTLDPLVFGLTLLVLLASGVAATLIPARRATRVDPMVALRYE